MTIAGTGALAAASIAGDAGATCDGPLPSEHARLPAPITVNAGPPTDRFSYRIGRDGRICRAPGIRSRFPRGADWFPDTGVWYMLDHGHLVVGRWGRRLWRSHGEYPQSHRDAARQIGAIKIGSNALAFTYDNTLYLAPLGGAERPVAHDESPLGFTTGGLYTAQRRQLIMRNNAGAVVRVIARRPPGIGNYFADGSLYFITRDGLMTARGAQMQRLTSLSHLGLAAHGWLSLQPADGLLELQGPHHLVLLHTDGSVFARLRLPLSGRPNENIPYPPVIAPDASAVAFTTASGDRWHGTETVYLLRAGTHTAIPVHHESTQFGCAGGATLQWHGRWLLYSDSNGNVAVIDTTGSRPTSELSRIVRRLPGPRSSYNAYWSTQPPTEPA